MIELTIIEYMKLPPKTRENILGVKSPVNSNDIFINPEIEVTFFGQDIYYGWTIIGNNKRFILPDFKTKSVSSASSGSSTASLINFSTSSAVVKSL